MVQSTSPTLLVEEKNGLLYLGLNRPGVGNALNYELIVAMRRIVEQAGRDWNVRGVVFEGVGSDFCVGENRDDLGPWPAEYSHRRPGGSHGPGPIPEQDLLRTVRSLPKPTIAVLHGRVLGVGLDLACVCDIRVCTHQTMFGDPRVLEADYAATGLTYVLPRLIGQSQAMRLLLLGETIGGEEAERIGLVYRSFPEPAFDAEARALLARIAEMPTRSYAMLKQQIVDELDMPYATALMYSLAVRQTNVIEDLAEGMAAFREKRKPKFRGR
jgi:2-(1,2-epoxy-1,2-dihydrophenyl)acetyl-CoA isomerase